MASSPLSTSISMDYCKKTAKKSIIVCFLWFFILTIIFLAVNLRNPSYNLFTFAPNRDPNSKNPPSFSDSKEKVYLLDDDDDDDADGSRSSIVQTPEPPLEISAVEGEGVCDLSKGHWVRDPVGPSYSNWSCSLLPDEKNCGMYGKNPDYMNWRWKPNGCELPKFDPNAFLEIVKGKTMAFIGDSLAQNHMESLLCLLSQVETPVQVHKDENDNYHVWTLPSYNFTIKLTRVSFLVDTIERNINGSRIFDIKMDKIHPEFAKTLLVSNYAIISFGNWIFRENYFYNSGELLGCVYCRDPELNKFDWKIAFKRILNTVLNYINSCRECEGLLLTMLRTYTPDHFEHGSWFTGGYCNRTEPLSSGELSIASRALEILNIQEEEMNSVKEKVVGNNENTKKKKKKKKKRFVMLDVTEAMMFRADAHPNEHYPGKARSNVNDCLHWCLPGPVDIWNDILHETLKKERFQ